jgi:5-methyltetrahydrofolate--homocysteine methyltransferase
MSRNILEVIKKRVLVSDGAMGTMLQQKGLPRGHCPEEWNISHSEEIAQIHREYYAAGADLVETNSFGGNRFRLDSHGFGDRVSEFNRAAAQLVRSVCTENKYVAGSVGPTGEFLEPVGTHTFKELQQIFSEQIQALVEGGVDLIIIETMADPQEASAAISAVKKIDDTLPVIATMTFEKTSGGIHTMMGTTPKMMVERLSEAGADVIGANCGMGMADMMAVITEIRSFSDLPVLTQANAGSPVWREGKNMYEESPQERAESVKKLLQLRPQIIGGCCGTTPDHIRAIRQVVDEFNHLHH